MQVTQNYNQIHIYIYKNCLINIFELNRTSIHLPDVHRPIWTSYHQIVIRRPPFYYLNREKVTGCQHDAFFLPQTQKTNWVITGNRANTVLDSCLIKEKKKKKRNLNHNAERLHLIISSSVGQAWWSTTYFINKNQARKSMDKLTEVTRKSISLAEILLKTTSCISKNK